jgi:hypothetical protein
MAGRTSPSKWCLEVLSLILFYALFDGFPSNNIEKMGRFWIQSENMRDTRIGMNTFVRQEIK